MSGTIDMMNIDTNIRFEGKLKHILSVILNHLPDLSTLVCKINIPKFNCEDQLMWSSSKIRFAKI
jgi:peroxiredoxin